MLQKIYIGRKSTTPRILQAKEIASFEEVHKPKKLQVPRG
jgi:hypothetical protein